MDNWFIKDTLDGNYNELHNFWIKNFEYREIPLIYDKKIDIFRIYEVDYEKKIYYIRNEGIIIDNTLIVSRFSDVIQFMEEINLFEAGNENNKLFTIVEQNGVKSLKLTVKNKNIYISKSEAKTMYKIYNLSRQGYSFNKVLENEYIFTIDQINEIKHH